MAGLHTLPAVKAADPTDVIDMPTYQRVSSLEPSEDLLEVDFAGGTLVAVGNQFGIGRKTSPAT